MKYFRNKNTPKIAQCEKCHRELEKFILYDFIKLCETCFFQIILEEELSQS